MLEKENLSNKIRNWKIKGLEKQKRDWNESSGSRVVYKIVSDTIIDLIIWIIIGFFVYTWWITKGSPIGCDRISVNLCNQCYGVAKQIGGNLSQILIP